MSGINKTQSVLIHIAKKQLGLPEEDYRAMLRNSFNAASSKELSYRQAGALIDEFKRLGFAIKPKAKPSRAKAPNLIHMVSPQELAKIEHLTADVQWRFRDGYQRWLRKYLRKDRITTSREASNVIEALKAMAQRRHSAAEEPF